MPASHFFAGVFQALGSPTIKQAYISCQSQGASNPLSRRSSSKSNFIIPCWYCAWCDFSPLPFDSPQSPIFCCVKVLTRTLGCTDKRIAPPKPCAGEPLLGRVQLTTAQKQTAELQLLLFAKRRNAFAQGSALRTILCDRSTRLAICRLRHDQKTKEIFRHKYARVGCAYCNPQHLNTSNKMHFHSNHKQLQLCSCRFRPHAKHPSSAKALQGCLSLRCIWPCQAPLAPRASCCGRLRFDAASLRQETQTPGRSRIEERGPP